MHFEVLVEDQSGKKILETIIPKLIDLEIHTYKVISYKGIGRIPKNLNTKQDPSKRILLEQLPRLLKGYGKTFQNFQAAVILVVDNDKRDCKTFKKEMMEILDNCDPKPKTFFRIAVEEMEAWLLGDPDAVKKAYSNAKTNVFESYEQDSICDTWEKLADAVYPGGSAVLKTKNFYEIGKMKSEWAEAISMFMDISNNNSPSFKCFCDTFSKLSNSSRNNS